MSIKRNAWPAKVCQNEVITYVGRFTGAGAANTTRVTGTGAGITSVNYNSGTGLYLVTFDDVGPYLLGIFCSVHSATGAAAKKLAAAIPSTYSASAKTIQLQVIDAATPSLINLTSNDELHICVMWSNSTLPNG